MTLARLGRLQRRGIGEVNLMRIALIAALSLGACTLSHAPARSDASLMDGALDDGGPCGSDFVRCGTQCVSLRMDPLHCGSCGNSCAVANATPRCNDGACGVARCNDGFGDCDGNEGNGCEARLDTDLRCGACGTRCEGATPVCDGLTRQCATGCSAGQTRCAGSCVDVQTNRDHCGACDQRCALANATAACVAGACAIATCNEGFADCDRNPSNGCEVTLGSAANCTGCGAACSGATPFCAGRTLGCSDGCSGGSTRCGMDCVDVATNTSHCGACNAVCAPRNTATARCEAGACRVVTCSAGFGDCNGNPLDGCEVDLRTSTAHCGACGATCATPNATARCQAGACSFSSCNAGFGDCDRIPGNGCEVDTRVSLAHCGACGATCAPLNATAVCGAGSCGFGTCAMGWASCDGIARNGCEVDTRIAQLHCGGCNINCTRPRASSSCESGACRLGACDPGWGNCNGMPMDGCEINTTTSPNHCGACGVACTTRPNSTPTCASSACGFRCNAGFADCNRVEADGCESTLNELSNCGMCGRACAPANATATCAGRACAIASCDRGWGDCNRNVADGCELALGTNANCLSCGDVCPAGQSCSASGCGP